MELGIIVQIKTLTILIQRISITYEISVDDKIFFCVIQFHSYILHLSELVNSVSHYNLNCDDFLTLITAVDSPARP